MGCTRNLNGAPGFFVGIFGGAEASNMEVIGAPGMYGWMKWDRDRISYWELS